MNGDEACRIVKINILQIKNLIKNEGYQNSFIIGHSSDDNKEI